MRLGKLGLPMPIQLGTKVTPKVFEKCFELLESIKDEDLYVKVAVNLEVWDSEHISKDGREDWLRSVFKAYNRNLKEIVDMSGMTIASFYRYFGIPRRTFQDWIYDRSVAPKYTLFMIQEVLGYVTRY